MANEEICAVAHPNIALVKYWGKRAVTNNVPAVSSISLTLDTLRSICWAKRLPTGQPDTFVLNDAPAQGASADKLQRFVDMLREVARAQHGTPPALAVRAHNNFPTAAGLASSASGFAALTLAVAHAFELDVPMAQMCTWARLGSGSAPRSLLGGVVALDCGLRSDGSDVRVSALAPQAHWPLRVIIAITSRAHKTVGSTEGMEHTRTTSPYYEPFVRAQPADIAAARGAIFARDFAALARVTRHSCMKMHAMALAADPPLLYWSPTTLAALLALESLAHAGVPVAPTIDAGPQLKAICLPEAAAQVASCLRAVKGVLEVLDVGLGPGAALAPEGLYDG